MEFHFSGSIFTLTKFLNKVKENVDENGKPIIEEWTKLLIPLDSALTRDNMQQTMQILHESVPIIRKLVPHIRDERLRFTVSTMADENEAAKQSNLRDIDFAYRK